MKKKYIPQDKKQQNRIKVQVPNRLEWTEKQKEFIRIAQKRNTKVMFVKGPAGVSKTFLAVYCALKAFEEAKVSDILYIRSLAESASKSMGYLPGEAVNKLAPYLAPLEDKLEEFLSASDIKLMKEREWVSGGPVNYLRGSHFADKYIICDESQNYDNKELTTIVTRLGEQSKMIFLGDPAQSDLPSGKSGFLDFYEAFENYNHPDMQCFEFTEDDVVRSEILKEILKVLSTIS